MKKSDGNVSVEFVVTSCHELKENLDVTLMSAVDALKGVDGSIRVVLDGDHDWVELPIVDIFKDSDFNEPEFVTADGGRRCGTRVKGVSVVFDIPWMSLRGVGPCRNWAAERSTADVLIYVDGHMKFPAGLGNTIADHLRKFPDDITCCKMNSVDWEWQGDSLHGGCSLHSFIEENVRPGAKFGQRRGVGAKWYKGGGKKPARKIACAMGACYGIRRERYYEIGKPWQLLRGWGCAEQTVSVANRMCGGRVWLLDDVVDHMYASPHHRGAPDPNAGIVSFVNHLAFVAAFCPEDLRDKLTKWMLFGKAETGELKRIESCLKAREKSIKAVREACGDGKNWHKLMIRKWEGGESSIAKSKGVAMHRNQGAIRKRLPRTPAGDVSQVVVVNHTRCEMCDALDSFVAVEGYRNLDVFEQASKKCKVCGHKAIFRRV